MSLGEFSRATDVKPEFLKSALEAISKSKEWPHSIHTGHDVPNLSGHSKDGKTIYVDKGLPESIDVDGKPVNIHHAASIHEAVEKAIIDHAKDATKEKAHAVAQHVEHAFLAEHGIHPAKFAEALQPHLERASKGKNTPKDLETK